MQLELDLVQDELSVSPNATGLEPVEMSLTQFLNDPGWKAFPDPKAREESKGMYCLTRPDGKEWRGGWIGKYPDAMRAKRGFHKNQVRYAIHGGKEVSERVLQDYPEFLKGYRSIERVMNAVHFSAGCYARIKINGHDRYFHVLDFPMYCRVSARGFVMDHQLCEERPRNGEDIFFCPNEIVCIALYRRLKEILPGNHRPHFMVNGFSCLDRPGVRIRFRILDTVGSDGNGTSFTYAEGKTILNIGWMVPKIAYEVDGVERTTFLYPSQLLAVQDPSGVWQDVQTVSVSNEEARGDYVE